MTTTTVAEDRNIRWGAGLMLLAGVGFIVYGIIFFILNFSEQFLELGISQNEVPVTRDQIQQFSPELFHHISHLHIAVAGFLIALGVAVGALAWIGVRSHRPGGRQWPVQSWLSESPYRRTTRTTSTRSRT